MSSLPIKTLYSETSAGENFSDVAKINEYI